MGIMVSQDDKNTELNQRISADLRSRVQSSSPYNSDEDDSLDGSSKKTGRFAWVWIIMIVLAILSLISIVVV